MTDEVGARDAQESDANRHKQAREFILAEARVQAGRGLRIVDVLNGWPDAYEGQSEFISPESPPSTVGFFLDIQDCLAAVGLLGQLLWPGRLRRGPGGVDRDVDYQEWAAAVREQLGLPETIDDWVPGAKELRDHFFHLPERIHAWATETAVAAWDRNVATFPIGFNFDPHEFAGSNLQIGEGLPRQAVFRNRGGDELLFWDARLSVNELVNELRLIADESAVRAPTDGAAE